MNTDGVFEGVAIGGDRYPGSTFFDHMKRYHDHPDVKMLVLLGEVSIRLTNALVSKSEVPNSSETRIIL